MKLKDLINKYEWNEVQTSFYNLYQDSERNIKGYKLVFEKLKGLDPIESSFEICIKNVEGNGEKYVHVNTVDVSKEPVDGIRLTYSLMFTPWNECAGMAVNSDSLSSFSESEIIVHCLWEMTYCGFDEEEIQKVNDEINEDI